MAKFQLKNKNGFTLVELLVAVGLFTVIVFFSLGALLTVYDSHRKSQSSKTVMDNLNLGLENMVRTVRFGHNYYCGISSDTGAVNDCSGGNTALSVTFNGSRYIYRLIGSAIQKSENGGSYTNITSQDTVITNLRFYVFNSVTGDAQPYVIAVIKGYVGTKATTKTEFSLQTLMSQRDLDL